MAGVAALFGGEEEALLEGGRGVDGGVEGAADALREEEVAERQVLEDELGKLGDAEEAEVRRLVEGDSHG